MSDVVLITPPDVLHTNEYSFLLIYPNSIVKDQFQTFISLYKTRVHVYLYEETKDNIHETIDWLLEVFQKVDTVILDIDNCPGIIRDLSSYFISKDKTYWLTNSGDSLYTKINRNRTYDLDFLNTAIGGKFEKV